MLRNNKKLLVVLASSMLLLASCDIKAKPSYNNDWLISGDTIDNKNATALTNNLRTLVYDKLLDDGSINSEVLNETLYLIAKKEIGDYDALVKSTKEEDKELVQKINARMDKKLYSAISSGSYDYRNKFNEELFVKTIQQSLTYSISNSFTSYHNDYVFLNDSLDHLYEGGVKEDGTAYTPDDNVPNVGKYVLSNSYAQYKEDTYLPEVYRELLVEKYIKDKEADSLGRAAGRKINYVAISESETHPEAAANLVHAFVEKYLDDSTATADLSILEKAWKGIDLPTDESDPINVLLKEAGFEKVTSADGNIGTYYVETLFGDVATNYSKINKVEALSDATQEAAFTGSGAYAKETGLEMEKNSLRKKALNEDGWYVKTNDSTSLPFTITSRLFDIAIANNTYSNLNGYQEEQIVAKNENNKYVKYVNGVYYLKPSSVEHGVEGNMDCVIYDKGTSTYYIIQIEEAVNSSKLRTGASSEANQYTEAMREEVVDEMTTKYASRDTYKEKALVNYLKEANILFHDTDVYEYFKKTYPDVWDEDADK